MVVNIRSVADVPIKANTTYIISLDRVLLINITDELFIPRDRRVVDWFTGLVNNVGEQNVFILTSRHPQLKAETEQQLRSNNIRATKIVCYLYKGEWIKTHRRKFNYRRVFVIEDNKERINNILNHNPDVTCYYLNNEIVHRYTAMVPKLTDVVAVDEYTYVLDADDLFIGTSHWYHFLYIKKLPAHIKNWLLKLQAKCKVIYLTKDVNLLLRKGVEGMIETQLPTDTKLVFISSNPVHTYNFGLSHPDANIVYITNY